MPLRNLALLLIILILAACQTTAAPTPAPKAVDNRVPVTISSNPHGAEIYINGSLVGSTTMSFRLPPGKHRIECRYEGFENWTRELEVTDQPTRIEARMKKN